MYAEEVLQKEQFEKNAAEYEAHYGDEHAERYRRLFYNAIMFDGLDLRGARVLEAMCGSGQTAPDLLQRGAQVTGLDISENMIEAFKRRFPGAKGVCASVLSTGLPAATLDCVVVVGGLHHLH